MLDKDKIVLPKEQFWTLHELLTNIGISVRIIKIDNDGTITAQVRNPYKAIVEDIDFNVKSILSGITQF